MQMDEFYAIAENGIIQIPEEFRNKKRFKVMVMKDLQEETLVKRKSDLLLPPTMNTKEWKFSREAANER